MAITQVDYYKSSAYRMYDNNALPNSSTLGKIQEDFGLDLVDEQLGLDDLSPHLNFVALKSAICCKIVHHYDHILHVYIYRANWAI